MKNIIISLILLISLNGCITSNYAKRKLLTEVSKWNTVQIEKNDGLIVLKDVNDGKYYYIKDGIKKELTIGQFVDYMVGIFVD